MVKSTAGLVILAILTGINGCMFYPVSEKDVIGTYQAVLPDGGRGLPDGGTEVLELKSDGTCVQNIALKDGRRFLANGNWEYNSALGFFSFTGLHHTIGKDEKINPEIEKITGVIQSPSAARTLTGRIIIGFREGVHYEKK